MYDSELSHAQVGGRRHTHYMAPFFLPPLCYTFSALFKEWGNGNVKRKLCIPQPFRNALLYKSPLPPSS